MNRKPSRGIVGYVVLLTTLLLIAILLNGGLNQTVSRRIEYPQLLDMIKEGKAEATAKPSDDSTYEGTIKTNSVAALRKEASKSAKAIKELSNGDKVTVYYKTKDSSGNTWYYVSDGKNKGYVYGSLISTSKKVPSK